MPNPTNNVVSLASKRRKGTPASPVPLPLANTPTVVSDDLVALFDAPSGPATPRARKKAAASRPKSKPVPRHSPEHKRALEVTAIYMVTQPVCDEAKATFAIRTAILSGQWADEDIVAAVQRVADSGYPLTSNSLSYQLRQGGTAERQVDPVIHQAIDAALEHLGRLDSDTMTETERTLAAAMRQLAIAVMHKAADAA